MIGLLEMLGVYIRAYIEKLYRICVILDLVFALQTQDGKNHANVPRYKEFKNM